MYKDREKERIYKVWCCIRNRCCNPKNTSYKNYGGRGIKLCDEWLKFDNFYNWAISNGYKVDILPNGKNRLTIDRIDVNGNYEPSNCRFVEFLEQQYNRRNTIYYNYKGKKYNLLELSKKLGISTSCLKIRIKRGWNENDICKKPTLKNSKKVIYKNKEYTLSELSKFLNIAYKELYRKLITQKLDINKITEKK